MNQKTFNLYMSIEGVSDLVNKNTQGTQNLGRIMSSISRVTSAVGVNTYDTALELVKLQKQTNKLAKDPATSKLAAEIKAASKS